MKREGENMIEELDVVALLKPIPAAGLVAGQVGTVVLKLDDQTVEVEFSDEMGKTFALAALPVGVLIALHYEQIKAA